jgi:hypothetical protein
MYDTRSSHLQLSHTNNDISIGAYENRDNALEELKQLKKLFEGE